MKDKESKITQACLRWLAKDTRGFIGGVVGGLVGGLIGFAIFCIVGKNSITSGSDAIAVANTYIVYTTFVIAAVALLLTVAGLIFTQHFAIEKERHMANAFTSLLDIVRKEDEKAVNLVRTIMENPEVVEHVSGILQSKIVQELKLLRGRENARAQDAKQTCDDVDAFINDLEADRSEGRKK